jgi:hypothetical protein
VPPEPMDRDVARAAIALANRAPSVHDTQPWRWRCRRPGLTWGAVVLGRLYERSGSLLVVALAHTAVNMASGTRGGEGIVAAVVSAGVIVAAMGVLAADRRAA